MTIRVGSLFSGIGGLDLGLERAGARVVWQCEIDPACQRVLRRRFPDAILYDDVSRLRGAEVGAVDILVGGFPCQDLSVAGKRAGLKGERSGLFHEFMRLASELAPRWVIIENVPGLLSSNAGRDMGTVLGTLGDLGYGFAYRVLDAQYFGVAQRRRRVFIVGCLGDAAGSAQVLFEPEGVRRNPPTRAAARARITGTLAASAGTGGLGGIGQSNSAITSRIVEATARTVSLRGREGGGTAELGGEIATALRASQGGGDKSYALVETVSTIQGGSRRGYRIDCRERRGGGNSSRPVSALTTKQGGRMITTPKPGTSSTSEEAKALEPVFFAENQRAEVRLDDKATLTLGGASPVRATRPLSCLRASVALLRLSASAFRASRTTGPKARAILPATV